MAGATEDTGMTPEMMRMSEEIVNLRGEIVDMKIQVKKVADSVVVQEGVLKESFRAQLELQEETIQSARLNIEGLASRVQMVEDQDYLGTAAAAAASAMEAFARRVEELERESSQRATSGGIDAAISERIEEVSRNLVQLKEDSEEGDSSIWLTVGAQKAMNEKAKDLNHTRVDEITRRVDTLPTSVIAATSTLMKKQFADYSAATPSDMDVALQEMKTKFEFSIQKAMDSQKEMHKQVNDVKTEVYDVFHVKQDSLQNKLREIDEGLMKDMPWIKKSLEEVNSRVDAAGRRGREEGFGDDGKYKPKNLTQSKSLEKLRYGGQPERYSSWKYKMEVFLESEVPSFGGFLKYLESEADFKGTDVTSTDLEKFQLANPSYNVPYMNSQLYLVLAASLEEGSAPLARVQNLHEQAEVRGALAWQTVVRDAVGMSGTRLQALATRVHTPDRVHKYSDVASAIEQWATLVREYESACGTGGAPHSVPDSAKITALRQVVPKELDADIGRQSGLKSLKEVRDYVDEQVIIRRQPYFAPAPGAKNLDKSGDLHHVPWEQNWTGWEENEWSQEQWPDTSADQELIWMGKGKGKGGKGKGGKG